MKEPIHILVTLDGEYVPHVRTMLYSLHANNVQERFVVHLLHRSIPEADLERLAEHLRLCSCELRPTMVDPSLFADAPQTPRYPQEMYYRLLAGSLLSHDCKRVLYLDPDVLVINPVRPLWELDLKGRVFAAAAHTWKTELGHNVNMMRLNTEHRYYNSGVLLIDVAAARREVDPSEVFRYARDHEPQLILPDQDVLNALYGKRTLEVDDRIWNYDARNFSTYLVKSLGEATPDWVMDHTAILHFCGRSKPWNEPYRYRFGLLYKHYRHLADRALGVW